MKRWLRGIGMLVAIVGSIVFIGYVMSTLDVDSLRAHLTARSLLALGAATLLYASLVPLGALAWQRMLVALGHREHLLPLLAIFATTQAGKYLPGNIGHHVGRVGLSLTQGIPLVILVASMAYEVCLLLLAGLFTAFGAGALSGPGLQALLQLGNGNYGVIVAACVVALGLAAVPLLSQLLPRLTALLVRRRGGPEATPTALPKGVMLQVILLYVGAMLLMGAGLLVLSLGLFPAMPVDYPLLTAALALAWVVGFVTPGAPAGLGVREALLLLLLSHGMGAANASLLILALRIATTLGDMLCFALGLAVMPRTRASRKARAKPSAMPGRDGQDSLR